MLYQLTDDEKNHIIKDEFAFIKSHVSDQKILQLPRLIYDIYFIYYILIQKNFVLPIKYISFDSMLNTYSTYCQHVRDAITTSLPYMIDLNNFIDNDIRKRKTANYDFVFYHKLLTDLVSTIYVTLISKYRNYLQSVHDVVKPALDFMNNPEIINRIDGGYISEFIIRKKMMLNENVDISDRIKTLYISIILRIINSNQLAETGTENIQNFLHELPSKLNEFFMNVATLSDDHLIDLIKKDRISLLSNLVNARLDANMNLLYKILYHELGIASSISVENFLLYRGANDPMESTIDLLDKDRSYSLSYNTSIFNGLCADTTACTYLYMTTAFYESSYAYKYVLPKFFYRNNDDLLIARVTTKTESTKTKLISRQKINAIYHELFFIPPIPAFLQLWSRGELWHVRSKVSYQGIARGIRNFSNIYNFNITNFPGYLISNLTVEQLEAEYRYILKRVKKVLTNPNFNEYSESLLFGGSDIQRKYLLYKSKYFHLKKLRQQ